MDQNGIDLTRRHLFAAGALGAVAAVGLTGTAAAAAPQSDKEKANVQVVNDFIKNWNDPDKAVTYLANDASVRMVEDQPPLVGPAAVAAGFKGFMAHGEKISVKTDNTFARGPVVVNTRVDTLTTPGKPDQAFKVVGVFVVKDGKIKEWTDYLAA